MRYIQRVLILTGNEKKTMFPRWCNHPFFPGSRQRNYEELLQGTGIPYEVRLADDLLPTDIAAEGEVRYSAIIFTLSFEEVNPELLFWIEKASLDHGVPLITDAFLLKKDYFLYPFGIQRPGKKRICPPTIRDREGEIRYQRKAFPYNNEKFTLGLRPFLRFLLQNWYCREIQFQQEVVVEAAYARRLPAVSSCTFGNGKNWLLNFHPSRILREGNGLHLLIREALFSNQNVPSFSLDLSRTVFLRMDDPGSCERVYLEGFNPGVTAKEEWEKLLEMVKTNCAKLNIAYVPGWIDDGDRESGTLVYQGIEVEVREPGKCYNSWQVRYAKKGTTNSHDYAAEYEVIKRGVAEGTITIISHGLTHLTTCVNDWLKAKDAKTNMKWYREFREMATGKQAGRESIIKRMMEGRTLLKEAFGSEPDILVPSAHETTKETTGMAKEAGFTFFSSRAAVFLTKEPSFTNRKLKGFFPSEFNEGLALCGAGYPATFVFHDFDICRNGSDWLKTKISAFQERGIRSFPSMELLSALLTATFVSSYENGHLRVSVEFPPLPDMKKQSETAIPFMCAQKIVGITVFEEEVAINTVKDGLHYRFSLPFSLIRNNKLEFSIDFAEGLQDRREKEQSEQE